MEETVNQEVVNPRDQLVGRMKSRYPDRNFGGDNGQDGQSDLESAILEALTEMDTQINDYSEKQKAYDEKIKNLGDLFAGSQRAAVFLNTLASTGDPSAAIYKAYGKDAHDAFMNGDASEVITNIEKEEAKVREENDRFEQEKADNLKASFAALDEWGNSKGLSDDDKVKTFMRFYDILCDAYVGKYSPDLFEMGWKADNYDNDVANARQEGEVAGRNAKIVAQERRRKENASMPPALSGQGASAPEKVASKEARWSDFLK